MTWREISTKLKDRRFLLGRLPWLVLSIALVIGACLGAWLQTPYPDPFEPAADSLWYPIERNPHLRLLSISSDLYAVTFAVDGQTGWAVGQYGTILKTTNGGETWEQPESVVRSPILNSVTFADDALRGWAVGWLGTILKTTDGGNNWRPVDSTTSETLTSVTFTGDGVTGWAVGGDGTILKSGDGGESWAPRDSGTTNDLESVTFTADGRIGWAVGRLGTILKTTNGGDEWTPRDSKVTEALESVTFTADGRTGWAVGPFPNIPVDGTQPPTILKTVDGGDTWERRPAPEALILNSVTFAGDGTTGWAVGIDGEILKTVDGGESWERMRSGTSAQLESVTFTGDGTTGWVVGRNGTILKTKDGGETWLPRTRGASDDFHAVTFAADGATGWIVGRSGTILATSNGGATWKPRRISTSEDTAPEDSSSDDITSNDLFSVTSASDGVTGWAAGVSGTILKTEDGGDSWMSRPSGVERDYFTSVAFADNGTTGWAVGWNGTVVRTTDAGESWTEAPERLPGLASVTSSVDGAIAWAAGPNGTIVKVTDEGQTWERLESGTTAWLESVTFRADGATGWAVGSGGTILKTADGGQNWARRPADTAAYLRSVAFARGGTSGWAVGDGGTILETIDGGETWAPSNGVPEALGSDRLTGVTVSDDGTRVWVVGYDGIILYSVNGGETWRTVDHRKYPSPWTWLVYAVGLIIALPAGRRLPNEETVDHVADEYNPDQPVTHPGEDVLQRQHIAKALSTVLSNPKNEPPLTIAVTGDWGQGKSSLMKLVVADLEKQNNYNYVWFNAWHHQKETHLFAALMQSIREEAIPDWWTLPGFRFRCRIALYRAIQHLRNHPIWLFIGVVIASSLVYLLVTDAWIDIVWCFVTTTICKPLQGGSPSWIQRAPFAPLAALAALALNGVSVPALKRLKPGKLLAVAGRATRIRTFDHQLGFRYRFSNALDETVKAMEPARLVIVIDDLDRCRSEQVVEILEAINFLVDAARCYIIMGIAWEQVVRCVGLEFKDIAHETPDDPEQVSGDTNFKDVENPKRRKRSEYARQYLKKIVNLEVPIPKMTDDQAKRIIQEVTNNAPAVKNGDPGDNVSRGAGKFGQALRELIKKTFRTVIRPPRFSNKRIARISVIVIGSVTLVCGALLLWLWLKPVPTPVLAEVTVTDSASEDVSVPDVMVIEEPPPSPGVTVSPTRLIVAEGSSSTYTMVLNTPPEDTVTIVAAPASGADPDLTVSAGAALTFTAENWDVAQTVTIIAAQDEDSDDGTATIEHTVLTTDSAYKDVLVPDVVVTELDDSTNEPNGTDPWWMSALGFYLLVAGALVVRHLWKHEDPPGQDSSEFKKALDIWYRVVIAATDSPRQLKRFVNTARLQASLSRRLTPEGESDDPSESQVVALAALTSLNDGQVAGPEDADPIPDCLVGALSESQVAPFYTWVHETVSRLAKERPQRTQDEFLKDLEARIDTARDRHLREFRDQLGTKQTIDRFRRIASPG